MPAVHPQGLGCPKRAGRREPGLQDCRFWPFSGGGGLCKEDYGKSPSILPFRAGVSPCLPKPAEQPFLLTQPLKPTPSQGRLPVRWMAIESLNYSVYTTQSDV